VIDSGTNAPQDNKYFEEGEFPFIRAGNLNRKDTHGFLIADKDSYVNKKAIKECGLKKFKKGTILFPKSGQSVNTNNIAKLKDDSFVVNHLACIYDNNEQFLDYVYYYLEDYKTSNLVPVDSNYPSINLPEIRDLLIPVPPIEIVSKIVSKMLKIEDGAKTAVNDTLKNKMEIKAILDTISIKYKNSKEKIDDLKTLLQRGKSPKYGDSKLQIIKSGQARGYFDFDFSERHFANSGFEVDNRKLERGDILINSTGVGTAGRVTYFDLEGEYVVDSHITILRPDITKVSPKFLFYTIANIGFDNLEKMAEGQSGQVELSLEIIKNIEVIIPPMPVQKKVMEEINVIDKKIKVDEVTLKLVSEKKSEILKETLYL
jgi:restriction endonuclease S subunit